MEREDKRQVKYRDFSLYEASVILGVSESYLKRLDSDWGEVHLARMRRNSGGEPVYSVTDLMVMKEVGIGRRPGRLRPLDEAMRKVGVPFFGRTCPPPEELERRLRLMRTAIPAKEWLKRKRTEEVKEQETVREYAPWWRKIFEV